MITQLTHSDIFIIGNSKSGKTSLAKKLSDNKFVSASGWVRSNAPLKLESQSIEEYTEFLGKWSVDQLKKNPDIAINYITHQRRTLLSSGKTSVIVEGIRNPRDFISLAKLETKVVRLGKVGNDFFSTFEKGIPVIDAYIKWAFDNELGNQSLNLEITNYECVKCELYIWDSCGVVNACCLNSAAKAIRNWIKDSK